MATLTARYFILPSSGAMGGSEAVPALRYFLTSAGGGVLAGLALESVESPSGLELTGFDAKLGSFDTEQTQYSDEIYFNFDVVPGYFVWVERSEDEVEWRYETTLYDDHDPSVYTGWSQWLEPPPNSTPGDAVFGVTYHFRARLQDTDDETPTAFSAWVQDSFTADLVPYFTRGFGATQNTRQVFDLDWTTEQPNLTIEVQLRINAGSFNTVLSVPGTLPLSYDHGSEFSPGTTLRFEGRFTDGVTFGDWTGQSLTVT